MFTTYFVCTGNRCRSPVAAGAFAAVTQGLPVAVGSLGLLESGHRSPRETIEAAQEVGLDLATHRSRALSEVDLGDADLVLGFEFDHVAGAVVDGGAPADKTFGLIEVVDLLERIPPPASPDPVERARRAVAAAHELRQGQTLRVERLDDPYGLPFNAHHEMVVRVTDLCHRLAAGLFGSAPGLGAPAASPGRTQRPAPRPL